MNKDKTKPALGQRLSRVYELVREGSVIYDIGSDHGHLPIALISGGVCPRAVVCDLNKEPLERARRNFRAAGLYERAVFFQTDGVRGIDFSPQTCDIAVCGMGGELISGIIDASPVLKDRSFHLLLQPMTRADRLREYLKNNGFSIEGEAHAKEADKLYVVMSVYYSGKNEEYTPAELLIGKKPLGKFAKMQTAEYYLKLLAERERILRGKESAGKASDWEKLLFSELKREITERIKSLK